MELWVLTKIRLASVVFCVFCCYSGPKIMHFYPFILSVNDKNKVNTESLN